MNEIANFVKPELLVLVPVLYFIGTAIKKSRIKDKYIPAILGTCGVALSVLWVLSRCPMNTYREVAMAVFVALTQGILAAGLSVYTHQLFKQAKKEE